MGLLELCMFSKEMVWSMSHDESILITAQENVPAYPNS